MPPSLFAIQQWRLLWDHQDCFATTTLTTCNLWQWWSSVIGGNLSTYIRRNVVPMSNITQQPTTTILCNTYLPYDECPQRSFSSSPLLSTPLRIASYCLVVYRCRHTAVSIPFSFFNFLMVWLYGTGPPGSNIGDDWLYGWLSVAVETF